MSKIGEKPIIIPPTVSVDIVDTSVTVKGKEGVLTIAIPQGIKAKKQENQLIIIRENNSKYQKSLHGLIRSLIANAVMGVETPWEKKLEVSGTGFNVKMQGEDLVFKVGYNHPVVFKKVEKVTFAVEGTTKITEKVLINNWRVK